MFWVKYGKKLEIDQDSSTLKIDSSISSFWSTKMSRDRRPLKFQKT